MHENIFYKKENKYMLLIITELAVKKFKLAYSKDNPRIVNCSKKMIDITYNGDFIYLETKYKRGVKCGQAYNINNLYYELIDLHNTTAIIFDCTYKRFTKDDIRDYCRKNKVYPLDYVRNVLKKEYNISSNVVSYTMGTTILENLKVFIA